MSQRKNESEKIASVNNKVWLDRSKKFLSFLSTWRDWKEIKTWAFENNITEYTVRNIIVYADGLIMCQLRRGLASPLTPSP